MRGVHAHNRPVERARAGERCALNLAGSFPEGGEPGRGDWVIDPALHQPVGRIDLGDHRVARRAGAAARRAAGAFASRHRGRGRPARGARRAAPSRRARAALCSSISNSRSARCGATARSSATMRRGTRWPAGGWSIRRRRGAAARGRSGWRRSRRWPNPMPATRWSGWSRRPASSRWRRSRWPATCRSREVEALAEAAGFRRFGPATPRSRSARAAGAARRDASRRRWPNGTAPSPTRSGRPAAALFARLRGQAPEAALDAALADLIGGRAGWCATARLLRLPSHEPRLNREDERLWERVRPLLAADGLRPPRVRELAAGAGLEPEKLTRFLRRVERFGRVAPVAPNRFFLPETVRELAELAAALADESPEGSFTAAAVQGPLRHRPQPDDRGARISRPDRRDPARRRGPRDRCAPPPSCSAECSMVCRRLDGVSGMQAGAASKAIGCLGRRSTNRVGVKVWTGSPSWFSVVMRILTIPWPGRDRDDRVSSTSISTRSSSPGRTGFSQFNSPPTPRMPPAGRKSLIRHSFIVSAAVCQPLAAKPLEQRVARRRVVEMKRLRVEFGRECGDRSGIDAQARRAVCLPGRDILEIQHFPSGRRRRSGQVEAHRHGRAGDDRDIAGRLVRHVETALDDGDA